MKLDRLHEAALHQLTGCRYAVLHALHAALCESIPKTVRGRPIRRTLWAQIVLTLIKLRLDLPYRTIEVMFRIDAVTAYRDVRRILSKISALALKAPKGSALSGFLIVDSTGTRVRSTALRDHSGPARGRCRVHRPGHHKRRKCQAIVTESGEIVSVSVAFAGSVHDKRIWNEAYGATHATLKQVVLADKAYVGAKGEGQLLLRPHRRSDAAYKADKDSAKTFNRALSKIRVKVEHVFAQMKHFRVLSNLFPFHPNRYGEVFRAVAVIHNFKLRFK